MYNTDIQLFRYKDSDKLLDSDGKIHLTEYRFNLKTTNDYDYHVWKLGDRLDKLSKELYGNNLMWWAIMDLNPWLEDPFDLVPGDVIKIPKR